MLINIFHLYRFEKEFACMEKGMEGRVYSTRDTEMLEPQYVKSCLEYFYSIFIYWVCLLPFTIANNKSLIAFK